MPKKIAKCNFFQLGYRKTALHTVLLQGKALSTVKLFGLKLRLCKKVTNIRYALYASPMDDHHNHIQNSNRPDSEFAPLSRDLTNI